MKQIIAGICDDSIEWCREAAQIIQKYSVQAAIDIETICFKSEEKLLSYEGEPLEILFMDIELTEKDSKGENGINTAEKVNKRWKNCQVVYLTNYLYYATEIYTTRHTYYVLKEQFRTKIGEVFQKVLHELQQNEKKLIFSVIGGKEVALAPNEIIYFERRRRTTIIQTVWGSYEIWDKLEPIMQKLPELDFVRCHNSYIVYLPAVREIQKGSFVMDNSMEVMISRSYSKSAQKAFMKWAQTQIS